MRLKASLRNALPVITAAAAIFSTQPAPAAPPEPGVVIEDKKGALPYRQTTLENGMRIISVEDFSVPIAAVQVWYEVGSKNERTDRNGFAHMFEHMMFRGTEFTGSKDHFEYIRKVGGTNNAYTAFDNTTYIQTVPANQLEMIIWLESERLAFLKVDDEAFQTERKVVEEELRLRAEQPFGTVPEKLLAEMFEGSPYAWTPGGSISHLRQAPTSELQEFWETYYVPNNATLVVVGAVKHREVERLARKYFGWMPRYPDPPRPVIETPAQDGPRTITIKEDKAPVTVVGVGYFGVPSGHDDEMALTMLSTILGGGESSRLYRRLVNESESAVIAAAGAFSLQDSGIVGAAAVLPPIGGDKEKARTELMAEIARIKDEGVTEEELDKARNNMLRDEVAKLSTVDSKASAIGQAAVIEGDITRVNSKIDSIRAVTREDIQRVARAYMVDERRNDITIEPNIGGFLLGSLLKPKAPESEVVPVVASPEGAEYGHGKPGLERPDFYGEKPPIRRPITKADLLKARSRTLDNGLEVVVVPDNEIPFVTYTLGIKTGAYADPADRPGTASMAAGLLTRGTENYGYEELAELLDRNAISLGGSMSMDVGSVNASAVKDRAEQAMELLAEVVRRPTFPEDEFEKAVKQARTGKAISEVSPEYLADQQLRKVLYGDHPYSRTADGSMKDLDNLTATASRDWWTSNVRPDTTVLYIAGDVTRAEAYTLAERYFGDWTAEGEAPTYTMPGLPEPAPKHIYLVDTPGATQSQIRAAHLSITRESPLYFETRVINQVFGGAFGARLNETIRVQKGLTYGAFGGFQSQRFAGAFSISTFSKTTSTAEAVQVLVDEAERLLDEPITREEMELAQGYLVGSFIGGRETPQDIVTDEWTIEYNNLPRDYFRRYLRGVASTTTERLAEATRELVQPDKLAIVVVGDASKLKADLEKVAPVTVVSKDQVQTAMAD
ncbi:MAG: pitrilysin family protein [Candidatus Sumerlaeia bacterium]|nr:pitrilysin family protein [Candidatus Sumerlaeia bacterium]